MSQPRRRRRRGRRGGQSSGSDAQSKQEAIRESSAGAARGGSDGAGSERSGRSRRRRGRSRSGSGGRVASPKSSEDLVRALPKERPETLTAPPDGQTLEGIIGELQSTWGVPPYPQEYRITVKVAEEREGRPDAAGGEPPAREKARREPSRDGSRSGGSDQPRREKAPAAPNIGSSGPQRERPSRKRRRRRRKPGGATEGGSHGGGSAPAEEPPSSDGGPNTAPGED